MSDNIYCVYDYQRVSIDTFYFGLKCDEFHGYDIFEEIKKNLLSLCCIRLSENNKGNIYYWHCEQNRENGFYICIEPRSNLLNDFITIQLSGKFFRDIVSSEKFIDWLFEKFGNIINVQRIDVALDICYKHYPCHLVPNSRVELCGFPIPNYNDSYKYIHNGFEFYGRSGKKFSENVFVNMIANGKGDCRLRVYDKTLDLMEKYNTEYSLYYDLSEDFEQVYRIEYQCRGKKLKGWYDKYYKKYNGVERKTLIDEILMYIFNKYKFDYVDYNNVVKEFREPIRFVPIVREKSLVNQYKYHSKMQNSHYRKCCDLADKIVLDRKMREACKLGNLYFNGDVKTIDLYAVFEKNKQVFVDKECLQ